MKRKLLILVSIVFLIMLVIIIYVLVINFYIMNKYKSKIYGDVSSIKSDEYNVVMILGAGIRNGKPTDMLKDRLDFGIDLYKNNKVKKILMTGDHGKIDYDEVNLMKQYAIDNGVPSEDIFMDHAGFSTYDSMYRAKEIFGINKMIIVTQKYHLYRALYIAQNLGIDSIGYNSNPRKYLFQTKREIREIFARNKDFISCFIKPEPKYLGEKIDITGDGNITNDKDE